MTRPQVQLLAFIQRGPVWFNGAATGATMRALLAYGFVIVDRTSDTAHRVVITTAGVVALDEAQAA